MLPSLSFAQAILLLVALQAATFAILIGVGVHGSRRSNHLLAALLACIAVSVVDSLLTGLGVTARHQHLAFTGNAFGLLIPPLVLLHGRSMMYAGQVLRPRDALHAAPFCVIAAISIFGYHLQPEATRAAILEGTANALILSPAVPLLIHLVVLVYVVAALRELQEFSRTVRQIYSNLEHKTLGWLTRILVAFVVVWMLSLALGMTSPQLGVPRDAIATLVATACLAFVNLFFVFAIRQPELFAGVERAEADEVTPEARSSPRLPERDAERYGERLEALMREERPFLDPELTLQELAGRIGLPERDLSALLNESLDRSFYDYVNHRRIEHAKAMLRDPAMRGRGVLEIMHDSGFRSKSAFYEAFRRHAGSTPAEFRRQSLGNRT